LLRNRSGITSALLLRQLDFQWRFRLARQDNETFLIFFHDESPEKVLIDATFRFRAEADPGPWAGPDLSPADVACELALPPFLFARPTPEEWKLFAPPGATPADTLLLRLGPSQEDILAVQDPMEGPEDAVIYLGGRKMSGPPWPVSPFLALTECMREWVTQDIRAGVSFRFAPPQASDRAEVRQIFHEMLRAACRVVNGLKAQQAQPVSEPRPLFAPMHTLFGFAASESEVTLRLRPDGQFAESMDEEMIEIAVHVRIVPQEGGLAATVFLKPPDFLLGGSLHADLLGAFVAEADADEIAEGLDISESAARGFLQALDSRVSIFRVRRRGETDTDVLAARAVFQGREVAIMLRGDFRIESKKNVEASQVKRLSSIKTLYAGPAGANARALDNKDVRYFLGVIASLQKLMGILK
jgi:hypothetical protein